MDLHVKAIVGQQMTVLHRENQNPVVTKKGGIFQQAQSGVSGL